MRRFIILFSILLFSTKVFSQQNNGVTLINNLPTVLPLSYVDEIIIDENGGGGLTIENFNIEGVCNFDIEKWVFISGNWILSTSTCSSLFGDVTWVTGQKIIVRALSDNGNNPCSSVSRQDHLIGFDSDGNNIDKLICIYSGTLPVTWLSSIKATYKNRDSHICWSVASQINNNKYIIEHSSDGRNFSPIGEIAGDGTSSLEKHYTYIHETPSIGINYYRIKQVDYDGKYSYSDIASVRYDGTEATSIYPNPATSEVTITTPEQTSLQIIDMCDRVIRRQAISEGQSTINLSELPTGMLIFVVGDQRFKVLKE